ncbi:MULTISPECIES: hypothetical protein [unclassified Arenibacter]|uniref:hypothetical protein n=1 Tax=unclassified Arenibacter TaxID=2615047 RepID=UPI000E34E425|nr:MULTISPECIES: hypothetical protein [unclassified Arenibacter]MCM4162119.1 hypothetical protein [Arenibacter sp. A80]RFT57736.1 hypothetical protein D0S24_00780 [Arenibacter sp. P308M17]
MKVYAIIPLLGLIFALNGCSTDGTAENSDKLNGTWSLINVSGGFAGVDEDFEKGRIIWKFDAGEGTLAVSNNYGSNDNYYGLPIGTYTYSLLEVEGQYYLQLNDKEVGEVVVARSKFLLDQNSTTSGSGADGFLLVLVR